MSARLSRLMRRAGPARGPLAATRFMGGVLAMSAHVEELSAATAPATPRLAARCGRLPSSLLPGGEAGGPALAGEAAVSAGRGELI